MDIQHEAQREPWQRALTILVLSAYCLVLTGSVHRQLMIRSEPPGAQVMINDGMVGVTPYAYRFAWYGWYRITLTKPGYEQLDDRPLIKCPFYLWIPFDLVMELLPFPIRDAKVLSYQLRRQTPLPEPTPPVEEPPETGGGT